MKSTAIIICISFSLILFVKPDIASAKDKQQSNGLPTPFIASYDLHRGRLKIGGAVYAFEHTGDNNYSISGSAILSGLLILFPNVTASVQSHWSYIKGRIQPDRYQQSSSAAFVSKKMTSKFDWHKQLATVTHNQVVRKVPIEPGDLDQSLVPLAVMLDLKKGKLKTEYRYVDRRRIKKYSFKKIGQEQIKTSLGYFDAIIVETIQKSKKKNKIKRRSVFWAVPKLDYLPVRVSYKSGDSPEVVMSLTKLRGELGYKLKK